ncbi:MAG: hypothetical protein VX640_09740 [Pseudomonadota bacterium]|nr:hypothetical protein [Pseudomonadota bacterium]
MRLFSNMRTILLAGSSLGLLAACSNADVASPGDGTPITPIIIPGGGGGSGGLAQNNVPPGGCPAGTTQNNNVDLGDSVQRAFCVLSGTLSGSVNLSANGGLPYLISGAVAVGTDGGASANLTIAPGAVLFGADFDNVPASGTVDVLFVTRGSQINANGTPTQPIIFTSAQDLLDDGQPNGTGGFSQWGGVALNGRAPINHCTVNPAAMGGTVDCVKNGEGGSGLFGGATASDSSGSMSYVRIQHAGYQFSTTNELNGLALQGVGSGTNLHHIQVLRNGDDSFEFFGGTVNAKYLIGSGADDDNFDWTDGWVGNLQFGLVVQESGHGDNLIEADNREVTFDNLPRSNPKLSNLTLIGAQRGEGVQLRHGTDGTLINGIVANASEGLEWDIDGTTPPQPVVNAFAFNGNNTQFAAGGLTVFNAGANNIQNTADSLVGVFPGPNESAPAITAINPTSLGAFFTAANYVGAFGPSDTPTNNWTTGWTVPGSIPGTSVACPAGTTNTGEAVPAGRSEANICRLPATITGNLTLSAGNLYQVVGTTFVGQDRGPDPMNPTAGAQAGVLTIDPGVTIISDGRANGFDILIVNRGSQILANGSKFAPVVLTSREHVFSNNGSSKDWGGLYINGRAPINHCTVNPAAIGGSVDCNKNGEAGSGVFGGATVNDNSGRVNYVRIEYSGFQFSGSNEANSFTLQGVGNGTEVDYVNSLYGADDGIELFGGTVNVKHLVLVGAEDDSFDVTDGWVGHAQFVIVKQDTTFAENDNGIEYDNREVTFDNLPRTNGVMSNFTLIGDGTGASGEAIQFRHGARGRLINTIATNFVEGLEFTRDGTLLPDPTVDSLILNANELPLPANDQFSGLGGTLFAAGSNNVKHDTSTLTNFPGTTTPLVPHANEVTPVTDPTAIDPFFDAVTYVGAVEDASDNWFIGWSRGL